MSSSKDLREVFSAARPLIEEWLDIAEQIAALRTAATEKGLDWSQIKALVKAQVQDERAGDNKRVQRIIEKAEFASAYADMLGLAKMNENNFSGDNAEPPAHDPVTVEASEPAAPAEPVAAAPAAEPADVEPFTPPAFLAGGRSPLRPHCRNPEACAGIARNHCYSCLKAHEAETEGAAA